MKTHDEQRLDRSVKFHMDEIEQAIKAEKGKNTVYYIVYGGLEVNHLTETFRLLKDELEARGYKANWKYDNTGYGDGTGMGGTFCMSILTKGNRK